MPISLRHIAIIISFVFSTQACVAENKIHRNTRFIVQLTDASIQKHQNDTHRVEAHRKTKLHRWSQLTGLILEAVPPTNQQRWIIKANTHKTAHIKKLIDIIRIDSDVKYIEKDIVMNINQIQRPPPMLTPATP